MVSRGATGQTDRRGITTQEGSRPRLGLACKSLGSKLPGLDSSQLGRLDLPFEWKRPISMGHRLVIIGMTPMSEDSTPCFGRAPGLGLTRAVTLKVDCPSDAVPAAVSTNCEGAAVGREFCEPVSKLLFLADCKTVKQSRAGLSASSLANLLLVRPGSADLAVPVERALNPAMPELQGDTLRLRRCSSTVGLSVMFGRM